MRSASTDRYSFYPNKGIRIAVHLFLWMLIFLFYFVVNTELLRAPVVALPNVLYSLIVVSVVVCNHYFFCYKMLPFVEQKKWGMTLLSILLAYVFSVVCTISPLKMLAAKFPEYPIIKMQSEKYKIDHVLDIFHYSSFLWVFTVVMFYNILTFFLKFAKDYYVANIEKIALLEEKNKMELSFLRSQIQPHFLFNTLNNIYGLVIDNDKASQSILKLSDLLRFSLYESNKQTLTLQREIKFLTDYINLEQMRHRDSKVSILYDFNTIEHPELEIKPLLLVNFIENAFKHGVNSSIENSWVKIILKESKNIITFSVVNNIGKFKLKNKINDYQGVGLKNVRRRLDLEYVDRYDLSIKETQEMYEIILTIKAEK